MNANETVTSAFRVCFGYVRRTAASPRTEDSQRLTLAQLVRARRGHNLLRQAASFDIHQTDTGPANFMDVELIPLCGFGHTEEKWLTTSERCIRNVLAFDIAALLQTLAECGHQASGVAERGAAEKPNHRRRQLLRARRERPDGGPTKQRDDLASSYVEHGLLPGTRCASLQQAQDAPEAPAGPWGSFRNALIRKRLYKKRDCTKLADSGRRGGALEGTSLACRSKSAKVVLN